MNAASCCSFQLLTCSVLPRAMLELAPTELRGPNEGGMFFFFHELLSFEVDVYVYICMI